MGVGLGHQFYQEPGLNLSAELGVSHLWEEFSDPDRKRNTTAGHWLLNYDQLFRERVTLFHDQGIYYRFKDKSWLIQTATGFRVKLIDLLHLSVRYEFDYDSEPQDGRKKDDSALLVGLGASW